MDFTAQAQNPGLAPLSMALNRLMNYVSQSIILLKTEYVILGYIEILAFWLLLPIAIFLRTFSPTRKMGTTMIAFTLGILIALPISIILGDMIYDALDPSSMIDSFSIPDPGNPPRFAEVCSPAISAVAELKEYGFWFTTCTPICMTYAALTCAHYLTFMPHAYPICYRSMFLSCWKPYVPFLVDPGWCWPIAENIYNLILNEHQIAYSNQLAGYAKLTPGEIDNIYDNVMGTALNAVVYNFIVLGTILIFTIILTIGTIRSIAFALGGDVYFYGLARLV